MSYGNDSDRRWVLDEAAAEPIIRRAVEGGTTFFDTAGVYSGGASEVATGRIVGKPLSRACCGPAAAEVALSDEEIARLEEPYRPRAILGHS